MIKRYQNQEHIKNKKISARVTEKQKKEVLERAEACSMKESEYVLYSCLKDSDVPISYLISESTNLKRIELRINEKEKQVILDNAKKANMKDLSKYVRSCCLGKEIIIIEDLKEFSKELHKIGNNLNQLTMLCHQGLIVSPDISETSILLKDVYKKLVDLNHKIHK
ncbi:plasmid mobilization protein [Anaeromicropila herbilytica]|uniref:Bacterial mobilisation domain-containing protein n=1 Tax=Anaeromicropila herbilytica TaxID=2785025 RepID=A0A7R7EIX1_9FIRM|nr:plasmid mobilization relaxosome protein MobC [Anaeromicropila herbilytica]BCN29521.1 hypothetical protein bsdtb5_08160 [Anaeromicropila herbilytica]